jgi:hypothetical protein
MEIRKKIFNTVFSPSSWTHSDVLLDRGKYSCFCCYDCCGFGCALKLCQGIKCALLQFVKTLNFFQFVKFQFVKNAKNEFKPNLKPNLELNIDPRPNMNTFKQFGRPYKHLKNFLTIWYLTNRPFVSVLTKRKF